MIKRLVSPQLITPKTTDNGGINIVVLDRVMPGREPEYHPHGKCTCYRCDEWCWLGSETYRLISSGEVAGVCLECMTEIKIAHPELKPDHRVDDERSGS